MKSRHLIALAWLGLSSPALAAQGSGCLPTTGTVSGLTYTQNVNAALAALTSSFSGASQPVTDCSAAPVKGQVWLDTSVIPNVERRYDGTSWVAVGAIDSSNHVWAPPVGGGTATIASASTTDICANPSAVQNISGSNIIASFGNACPVGVRKTLIFTGPVSLTHNASSMILPAQRDYTANAGDAAEAVHVGAGNWRVLTVAKADGTSVSNPSVPIGTMIYGMWGTIPPKTVYASSQPLLRATYPDYLNAVTRVQNGSLTSGQTTIVSVANTAGMGAGMPIEGTGIPTGTTVASVTSSTIVMSAAATQSIATPTRVFFTGYGFSGDSTTVGAPDCRGRTMAGRDDAYFGAPGRLTVAGSGINGSAINAAGGTQNQTIGQSQLPNVSLSADVSGSVNSTDANIVKGSIVAMSNGTGIGLAALSQVGATQALVTSNGSMSGSTSSINGGVTQSGLINAQPTLVAECVVVVLP